MDYVEGRTLPAKSTFSQKIIGQHRQTLATLHGQNYVYGDLRGPNVVVSVDENGDESVKLLDFDWGEGVVLYPADLACRSMPWRTDPSRTRRIHASASGEWKLSWIACLKFFVVLQINCADDMEL
jgi:Ser/Thr protein kinase RdoA (MazF antagonist)